MSQYAKTPEEIAKMKESANIAVAALQAMKEAIDSGERSLVELDRLAESTILSMGGNPAFKNYTPPKHFESYKWATCLSVNEEVVHGIPTDRRQLIDGDIIGLDCGAVFDGWYSDTAITVGVGKIDSQSQLLLDLTQDALEEGIKAAYPNCRISEITGAIHRFVQKHGLIACESLTGHGIGSTVHESPLVPNKPNPFATSDIFEAGMVICVEPMLSFASKHPRNGMIQQIDNWTIRSADLARVAHFEHMLAHTQNGIEVLTR